MKGMLRRVFGCAHRRTTFPLTPVGPDGRRGQTYVACLDCAREFAYDWAEMRPGPAIGERAALPVAERPYGEELRETAAGGRLA